MGPRSAYTPRECSHTPCEYSCTLRDSSLATPWSVRTRNGNTRDARPVERTASGTGRTRRGNPNACRRLESALNRASRPAKRTACGVHGAAARATPVGLPDRAVRGMIGGGGGGSGRRRGGDLRAAFRRRCSARGRPGPTPAPCCARPTPAISTIIAAHLHGGICRAVAIRCGGRATVAAGRTRSRNRLGSHH